MAEPLVAATLARSPAFLRDARWLLGLSAESLRALVESIAGAEPFDLTVEQLADLAARTDASASELIRGIAIVEYLYFQRVDHELSDEAVLQGLAGLARLNGIPSIDDRSKLYTELLQIRPEADRDRAKHTAIQIAPGLTSARISCDLRSVAAKSGEIEGYVPVALARLQFDEDLAGQSAIVFQLTEEKLQELESAIGKAREVMRAVRKMAGDQIL